MSADILLLLYLGLQAIVVNYFLRKTSLLTHVGKIRDLRGEALYRNYVLMCVTVFYD